MTKVKNKKKNTLITKGSVDYIVVIVVILLVTLGLIMVLSASSATALSESGDSYKYFFRQLKAAICGIVCLIVVSFIDYKFYRKLKWIGYFIITFILFAVGFIGMSSGGATRWINIAGINFQPSEVAKVILIVFFASLLTDIIEQGKIKKFVKGFVYPILWLLPIGIAVFGFQNHLSATLVIFLVTFVQMLIAGVKLSYFMISGSVVIVIALAVMKTFGISLLGSGFRGTRIKTWLDPFSDITGEGWQIVQSLYAIGSGGIFGAGLGQSRQKYLYLPEPQNDFIFAVIAEELGYVGCIIVIVLFLILIYRGVVISMRARDIFGSLIAIGVTTLIGIQALINIAVVTGTIPVTGMELPFFSYGGTAIICNLVLIGLLLNVSKTAKK